MELQETWYFRYRVVRLSTGPESPALLATGGSALDAQDMYCWDVHDVGAYLKRPASWVYDNVRKLGIPHSKIGQALRFRPRDVVSWAENQASAA